MGTFIVSWRVSRDCLQEKMNVPISVLTGGALGVSYSVFASGRGARVPDPPDERLVEEARAGSVAAFERLMERYERLVYRVALGFTGQADAALDVSQNVFLRMHEKLGTWRGTGELRSWIARLTMNEALNWTRGERRHRAELFDDDAPDHGQHARAQEHDFSRSETQRLVERSLESLNPRQRLAVVLRYYDDMPVRDIATALECTEGVAKNVLFRSLRRLRDCLETSKAEVHR